MFDEPTPLPADFGLVHPLAPNPDQNLLLSASARWKECRDQWLELITQRPNSTSSADLRTWWNARAPGTAVSRRALATRLYVQHFEASSQLAFAQGNLTEEQMKVLSRFINPAPDATAADMPKLQLEQPALKSTEGGRVELSGALVISQDPARSVPQMLYLPSRQSAWMSFQNRDELERWLIEHQPQLFGQSRLEGATISIEYTAPENPVPAMMLSQFSIAFANSHHSEAVFAPPPDLPPEDASESISLFGLLNPDIPLDIRRSALAYQHTALVNLLGKNFPGDQNEPRLQTLKQQLDALSAAEQASTTAASALLYTHNPLNMLELRNLPSAHYTALYQARLAGLRAEADVQLSLNQISAEEHQWLKTVLEAPDQMDRHSEVVVARLTLSATETEGASITTQTQELNGVLLFTHPSGLQTTSPHSLLLYWPGRFGGLQRFDSRQALEQTLFKLTTNDKTLALHLSPLTGNPFEYALQNQLYGCEQQAARLIADNPVPPHAKQRDAQLEKLRAHTIARITVPIPAARELAYVQLLEQNHSSVLAGKLPQWLVTLSDVQRARLKGLFTSYIAAMKRSHELLERDLPPRDAFSKKIIDARLVKDFTLEQGFEVMLDLPDSTTWQKVLSDGAAPGTPQQNVLIASKQRSKLSLVELAHSNIDQPLWWRLSFMQVEVSFDDETERQKLKAGITQPYLRKLVTELDLAGQYEVLIRETFLGTTTAPAFRNEHRRECLSEPWRLMLKLQGEVALLKREIDSNGWQALEIAIDANSPEAYEVSGKHIVLRPAHLSVGGADTDKQGPSTLSGVTFIEERNSGLTLLYLPDSPDGQFLRQYDSLEEARKALFNLCLHTSMVNYLAGRALHGDFAHHVSRINQALLKNFDAMMGIGMAWPATTSLATHLLNVHMGRLLEAHRATSRSNDALYLEHCALKSGAMFNYLKMALGMVPFVGTAIALYDAWGSANLATAAFLRGDVGHGLAEVEAVLLSLIDAAMDILPGVSVGSRPAKGARSLTRIRQLGTPGKGARVLHAPSKRHARLAVQRFAGYEYEKPITLIGLQPGNHGIYRNVYRHADGDFIVRQGRIFQIEWSKDSRNWRLTGTRQKTYKQPIGLDEAGRWDTYYHVYGVTFEGGGLGGGAVLGHLANRLDPIWPGAIRERLPRWWTDQAFRRQHALTEAADDLAPQLDAQVMRTNVALEKYNTSAIENRPALRLAAETACNVDIEMATRHYQTLVDLLPLTQGNKRRALVEMQSNDALILADRHQQQLYFANHRADSLMERTDNLINRLENLPDDALTDRLRILEDIRKLRQDFIRELDQIDTIMRDLNLWYERMTVGADKSQLTPTVTMLRGRLSESNRLYLRTGYLLEVVKRFDTASDVSWLYLQTQAQHLRARVDRALFTQYSLPEVITTKAQRNQILQDCLDAYTQFRRAMNVWTASYPQHFHLDAVPPLLEGIEKMAERARKAIVQPTPASSPGQSNKKIFTTDDNQLLIGVERWEPTTQTQQYTLTGRGGINEVWEQDTHGKFRLLNPPEQSSDIIQKNLDSLVKDAQRRLESQETYKAKVQSYAAQDMLPVDLEHMMASEADELIRRARYIEEIAAQNAIIQQLRDKATELMASGRQLRTRQALSTKKPTDGMLDDLINHDVVEIRKTTPLKNLGKRRDGRTDHLQEYEIWDLTQTPPAVLWYAHFHYSKATPGFNEFEKAHLKLPQHRFLTHADTPDLPYADIGKRSVALTHFENL